MKIVARIRQLLSTKETTGASVVERATLPITPPPEPQPRRVVERPAPPRPSSVVGVAATRGGFRLEGEGIEQPIADPSEDTIRRELQRLRSSGPSFVVLMAPDGSYLQAAGNAKRMTVEGHIKSAQRITHVVLGRLGSSGPMATIVSTSGSIEVRASEVWTATEAVDLFAQFAATGSVSPGLSQRDITASIAVP